MKTMEQKEIQTESSEQIECMLCQRIEELEKEKLELNEQLDIAQRERDALSAHVERLVRVNREQQALLDQIYQYVDEQGLAKLGQARVKALIEAHKRAGVERDALADVSWHEPTARQIREMCDGLTGNQIRWMLDGALTAAPRP